MPTGYTQKLYNGPQTFEDFVIGAARGMAALITMRDSAPGTPTPRVLTPQTKYYKEKLKEAKKHLYFLQKADDVQLRQRWMNEIDELREEMELSKTRVMWRKRRYQDMLDQVRSVEWPDSLLSFRNFMIGQLEESMSHDCSTWEVSLDSFEKWKEKELKKAMTDIERYSNEIRKEVERTRERNEWLADLWEVIDTYQAE
jgi:hypothetical protein